MTVTVTVTTATATIVVRRNGPGDIGRDDREHSGRAHQVNSRTHTHTTCTHHSSLARSFARLLARGPSARARACRHDVRRRRGKKKHRGSAIRADTRHCALARYRLAPVLHGRTRRSLLERLVAKLRGRAPSLSRGSCPSVSRCQARAPRTPSPSTPIAPFPFLSPAPDNPPVPTLCILYSIPVLHSISFLPIYPPRLPLLALAVCAHPSLSPPSPFETPPTLLSRTSIRSLFLFPHHPRPRGKRFAGRILSPRGSRATCVLVLALRGNAIPLSRRGHRRR